MVVYLALNYHGSLLATASQKGTVIRIYHTVTHALLQELRRGTSQADINHLSFHRSSRFLACASSRSTIHIFELFDATAAIDPSEYLDYLPHTPGDEVGYENDRLILLPGTCNRSSK
jgi:hypothetical protein